MKCLIVDLCGTLVTDNTTHGFLLSAGVPRWRRISARIMLSRPGAWLIARILRVPQRTLLVRLLSGISRKQLLSIAGGYAVEALRHRGNRPVLNRVAEFKARGEAVYVASASLDFIVEAFANALAVHAGASTKLNYNDVGRCMGTIRRDATGVKLTHLRELLGGSFAFDVITDNPEDTDLMSEADSAWFIKR